MIRGSVVLFNSLCSWRAHVRGSASDWRLCTIKKKERENKNLHPLEKRKKHSVALLDNCWRGIERRKPTLIHPHDSTSRAGKDHRHTRVPNLAFERRRISAWFQDRDRTRSRERKSMSITSIISLRSKCSCRNEELYFASCLPENWGGIKKSTRREVVGRVPPSAPQLPTTPSMFALAKVGVKKQSLFLQSTSLIAKRIHT